VGSVRSPQANSRPEGYPSDAGGLIENRAAFLRVGHHRTVARPLLLFMFFLPSFRFPLRPRVLRLLSLRSLLVSLWLLTFLLRVWFWPLTLRLSVLLMWLNLSSLLILLLPLMS